MLTGKNILLGVSGGIAAYKMANVASMLTKLHADVHVMMTRNATHFIPAETFEVLTKNKVYLDTFDERPDDEVHVPHISLGTGADCILIAPATANVIGKLANGIADDMLTTTVLPARCPILVCPSMNVYMLENPIVQDNIEKLKRFGFRIIEPDEGYLACGYEGKGKLPKEEPARRIWQESMSLYRPDRRKNLWIRSVSSRTTPQGKWDMHSQRRRHTAEQR